MYHNAKSLAMILSNTSRILDKLNHPDPILNFQYWKDIKELLVRELEKRKRSHAIKAVSLKAPDRVGGDLPTKEELQQHRRYQYHLTEANFAHAMIYFLDLFFEESRELLADYHREKNNNYVKASKTHHKMMLDLERLTKTVAFLHKSYLHECAMHNTFLDIAINLNTKLRSYDREN